MGFAEECLSLKENIGSRDVKLSKLDTQHQFLYTDDALFSFGRDGSNR